MSEQPKRRISVKHYGPKRAPEDADHSTYVEIMIGEEEWVGQGYQSDAWYRRSHSRVLGLASDEEVLELIQELWESISDEEIDLEAVGIHAGRKIFSAFQPGVRVIYQAHIPGSQPRWGTVVSIDKELMVNEHLRVLFDDGEERQINQDVMRTVREGDVDPKEVSDDGQAARGAAN